MRTQGVVFIATIRVAGNYLFIDEIGLLTILSSLESLTCFSGIGDITDCEGVEGGAFYAIAVSIGL